MIFDPSITGSPAAPADVSKAVAAVPEPGTIALLLASVAFLTVYRRTRRVWASNWQFLNGKTESELILLQAASFVTWESIRSGRHFPRIATSRAGEAGADVDYRWAVGQLPPGVVAAVEGDVSGEHDVRLFAEALLDTGHDSPPPAIVPPVGAGRRH